MKTYRYVTCGWDDESAAKLDPVGRLVYRSNLLGSDRRITNTGGGNTSSKLAEKDPLTGEDVDVLWVKGSGGDLRTAGREFFSSLPTAGSHTRGSRELVAFRTLSCKWTLACARIRVQSKLFAVASIKTNCPTRSKGGYGRYPLDPH